MTDGDVVPERVHHTGHIPQWKVDEVADIKRLIKEHNIFGLAKIRGISSSQIQKIRQETRGDLGIKVARNNLLRRALRDMDHDRERSDIIQSRSDRWGAAEGRYTSSDRGWQGCDKDDKDRGKRGRSRIK